MDTEKILSQMTLKDKIAFCSGASFWTTKKMPQYGIDHMFMCDGPHGLRRQEPGSVTDMLGINRSAPATCFPTAVTTASGWDPEMLERIGAAIGEEARDQGSGLVLGPGCNIKRDPLCGRNFEYFSEDPYLCGKLAAAFIRGVEQQGVGSSLKHFAMNNQEYKRFQSNSLADARTMREIYLAGFEAAVKEGRPATVMCGYNLIDGVHCSDNKELLTDILRDDWGFEGMVVTDWGAMNDRIKGFQAGCDLNMPGGSAYMEKDCLRAVKEGTLSEEDIDASVRRIMKLVDRAGQAGRTPCDYQAHHRLAVQAATQGAVLLKNAGILPLSSTARIALIGHMAKEPRYQGAGSSHINPTKLISPAEAMPDSTYAAGCDARGDTTEALLEEACLAARAADVAVVFAGLPDHYESEGFDREDMKMPQGHIRMIERVVQANPNTVVVLLCGSPVECPWADSVKAILYMGLGGQGVGQAAADLLMGRADPGGRLAESWPVAYEDCPTSQTFGKQKDALYLEGVYVGYRYYEKADIPVRWPFGYGLSYTSFRYSDLELTENTASVTVTNTGELPGSEVVQLYICPPQDGIHRPLRELKRFQKLRLQPGESRTVRFTLDERCFCLWQEGWKLPGGTYTLQVGDLTGHIYKAGEALPIPRWQPGSWYSHMTGKPTQKDWETMLGRTYTPRSLKKGQFTMDDSIMEMRDCSGLMRFMYRVIEGVIARGAGGRRDYSNPEFRMLMECSAGGPLRSLQISSGVKGGLFRCLLEMANGRFFRGLAAIFRG